MATAVEILLNYKEALKQADKLDELASELETYGVTELNTVFSDIRTNWQGENAETFLKKTSLLPGKNKETVTKIRKTASAIRTIAETVYNAEMQALELAATRIYH